MHVCCVGVVMHYSISEGISVRRQGKPSELLTQVAYITMHGINLFVE